MTAVSQLPDDVSEQDRQHWRAGAIGGRVLDRLGRPAGAHWVRVRHLWENRYRVNVFVGDSAVSAQIAHSFFVAADDVGNIISSEPAIRKVY